jgi:protein TonB
VSFERTEETRMFDHYMTLPRWRSTAGSASMVAAVAAGRDHLTFIIFALGADKMSIISKVEPPTIQVHRDGQCSMDEPPPPPPPPPPPAGETEEEPEEEEEKIPDEEIPEEEIVQPKETPDKMPDAKAVPRKTGPGSPAACREVCPGGCPAAWWAGSWAACSVGSNSVASPPSATSERRRRDGAGRVGPPAADLRADPTSKDFRPPRPLASTSGRAR